MLGRLHLVRHCEVHNPDHVVYADLPGFSLSAAGRQQALATARHIASLGADIVVSSPLERAVETAAPIAEALGVPLHTDDRLTEWRLGTRWAGVVWERLDEVFPGELDAYLSHPADLPFSPESIVDVAARIRRAIDEAGAGHPGRAAVVVSHQDPVQAARLALTRRSLDRLPIDKPGHGTVITLDPGDPWVEVARWDPPEPETTAFPPPR